MRDKDGNRILHEYQDLGELKKVIRQPKETGASGVEMLVPDDGRQIEALEQVSDAIHDHYGNSLDRLCDDDQRVIIERVTFRSDDLPYIEFTVVDEVEEVEE